MNLTAAGTGEAVDAVVEVCGHDNGFTVIKELWHGTQCRLREDLALGIWTLYGYRVTVDDGIILEPDEDSSRFQKPTDQGSGHMRLKEICAGIGGFSAGAREAGFETVVFLDHCKIACNTIAANGGKTICASIADRNARIALHEVEHDKPCLATAGFPCQPYSRQGDGRGSADERAHTLTYILLAAWYMQVEGLVLECVVEASNNPLVRTLVAELASKMQWDFHNLVLDLADQWPSRRQRWWCTLLPSGVPFGIRAWGKTEAKQHIASVIPEWPCWDSTAIEQLKWDEQEMCCFLNPNLGDDSRTLDQQSVAPTALHSWGSQLRSCPCGCRGPLSMQRLQVSGLRGFGVRLSDLVSLRHPHPQEVGLLNGLSVRFAHLNDLRAALCLVGQLASLLQACWVFAQVRQHREVRHGLCPSAGPEQVLSLFKQRLLQERDDCWVLPSMHLPRILTFQQQDSQVPVKVGCAVQVSEVIRAERQLQGPGLNFQVQQGQRLLPADALLHGAPTGYQLLPSAKRQKREGETCHVLLCMPEGAVQVQVASGALPCQVLTEAGLPAGTQVRFASTQEEVPQAQRLYGRHILDARLLHEVTGTAETLSDNGIAGFAQAVAASLPAGHAVLMPRTASLLCCLQLSGHLEGMSGVQLPGAEHMHVITEIEGHWFLLSIAWKENAATLWDPHPLHSSRAAAALLAVLCSLCGREQLSLRQACVASLGERCCGAVALCHLLHVTGLVPGGSAQFVQWVQEQASILSVGPALHWGSGVLGMEAKRALTELLLDKGVPEDKVGERIAEAVGKLGVTRIEDGLRASKPWAVLKSAATGLSQPFRWIKAEELEAQIRKRADNKFGTAAAEAKDHKARKGPNPKPKSVPQLDPRNLVLVEGAFVAEDGTRIPNLSLEDVASNAHGVAVCSPAQAQPFLDEATSISVEPLAVVSTAPMANASNSGRQTQELRFPAIYGPTTEPILVAGTLIQLGDAKVLPAPCEAEADQVRTGVLKITVYKDQWEGDWEIFSKTPIKCLMQQVPMLNLCKGQGCGSGCPRFHASIDEAPDTVIHEVWARKFQLENGTKAACSQATAFQVFVRVPASATAALQQTTCPGVYIEPRETGNLTGPSKDYAVIWLPGLDHQAALHSKRKADRALALTRLGHKYGVRVRASDEEAVFKILRPDHAYSRVKVALRYKLYPLPHGLTRQGLQQLLDSWKWAAKPLQPTKGDGAGSAWEIGAEVAPPSAALATSTGFALPVQISTVAMPPPPLPVLASSKTRKHMHSGTAGSASVVEDPWANGQDPWTKYRAGSEVPKPTSGAASKIREVQQQLKQDVEEAVHASLAERNGQEEATESRFRKLEAGLNELHAQGRKFEHWFAEAGKRMDQQASEVGAMQNALQSQRQEIGQLQTQVAAQGDLVQSTVAQAVVTMRNDLNTQLSTQLNAQMEQFQALLSKKNREGRSRS